MNAEAEVGKKKLGNGTKAVMRLSKFGELVTLNGGAKYREAVENNQVFIGSNAMGTAVTTQAGLSATTPALTLYNPTGSGVNLVLLKVNISITAAPAAATVFALAYNTLLAAAPSSTTDATVVSGMVGMNCNNVGRCYRVATLPAAPVAIKYLGGILAASSTNIADIDKDIDGEIVIPQGGCISIQTTTAAAILASFTWEEVPV